MRLKALAQIVSFLADVYKNNIKRLAPTWLERQERLVPAKVSHFHERPFLVVDGGRFAIVLREKISDPVVKRIAARRIIGNVDQFSDSTDLVNEARSFRSL